MNTWDGFLECILHHAYYPLSVNKIQGTLRRGGYIAGDQGQESSPTP